MFTHHDVWYLVCERKSYHCWKTAISSCRKNNVFCSLKAALVMDFKVYFALEALTNDDHECEETCSCFSLVNLKIHFLPTFDSVLSLDLKTEMDSASVKSY